MGFFYFLFPPPADFDGEEHGRWGDEDYHRECTAKENGVLAAARESQLADQRTEEETERDTFFAELKAELDALAGKCDDDDESPPRHAELTAPQPVIRT